MKYLWYDLPAISSNIISLCDAALEELVSIEMEHFFPSEDHQQEPLHDIFYPSQRRGGITGSDVLREIQYSSTNFQRVRTNVFVKKQP